MNPEQETHSFTSPVDGKRKIGEVTLNSSLGSAIALCIAFVVRHYSGIDLPGEVQAALAVIIGYAGAMFGGWLVKPGSGTRRK